MALRAEVEAAERLTDGWRELFGRCEAASVFQHPTWHRAWWDVFDGVAMRPSHSHDHGDAAVTGTAGGGESVGRGEQRYYAARDDGGELVGVAPMQRLADGTLTFSGDPEIMDYMDVTAVRGREPEVIAALLECWRREGVRSVRMWGLRDGCSTLQTVRCGEDMPAVACEEEAVAPRIALAGGWEEYLGGLSKKDRHELRRKMRRLEGAGYVVGMRVLSDTREVDAQLDEFLHLATISREDKAEFLTPQMETFFRRIAHDFAEEGIARLFFIDVNGAPAAGLLAFEGEDLAVWNSGYDPQYAYASIGLYSKAKAIEWAIGRGHPRVDFLRGREPYKYDLGGVDLQIFRCAIEMGAE